jgi:hypothetical protein
MSVFVSFSGPVGAQAIGSIFPRLAGDQDRSMGPVVVEVGPS